MHALATQRSDETDRLRRRKTATRFRGLALYGPLLLIIILLFVAPILSMLVRAFDNSDFTDVMRATITSLADWDERATPADAAFKALASDLSKAVELHKHGLIAARLNKEHAGFLTLINKTTRRLNTIKDARRDLVAIDPAWGTPEPWKAIRSASSPVTAFNLLAAMDLRRNAEGAIAPVEAERAIYLSLYMKTIWISACVTILCLLIGYPVAAYISQLAPRYRQFALFMVLMPLWTSILVRSAAWIILLQRNGVLNELLQRLHVIDSPLPLIYNRFGTYLVTVHVMLPFVILPAVSVMRAIPVDYFRAALSLGAKPSIAFASVYFPLSFPGALAGGVLVFVLSLGNYITPALVGGSRDQMISYFIYFFINQQLDWGMAGALCIVLLAIIAAVAVCIGLALRAIPQLRPAN